MYSSIVVGTDGSPTSHRAIARAAELARGSSAKLVIVSAYTPASRLDEADAADALGDEAFLARGASPAEEVLKLAADVAVESGATDVVTQAVDGAPVDVLKDAVKEHGAGLVVVGNRGLNSVAGRLLGSVPSGVARSAGIDVLIVHTTD
ncbi:universal stress protein [Pseudonocardia sp. WMMC193]|uniref:universal stress protein n=1 Tax=Pseudonocardia sp. WMMC193 TaxID=2911965 RepID=UPI001F1D5551|nr:universal stress protein [Pseudonocardia sp. WMMC193]MCF7550740.1 universal stress protein [Pseudonocardia sp. WMMC193]